MEQIAKPPVKVLVVHDDQDQARRTLLESVLRNAGIEFEFVTDGIEALMRHNEALLGELKEKMVELERANRGLQRDLTERQDLEEELRTSELRFRQMTESVLEVFWMGTPDGNTILYVSPAYEKVWGRSCLSLYENPRSWFDAVHPDDRDRVAALMFSGDPEPHIDDEYRIVRPDGSVRWIHSRVFPVRGDLPGDRFIAGASADVTERKEIEASRLILEQQILRSEKMEAIGTLAGGIAHDFNNMLGVIVGNAELAGLNALLPEDVRTSLDEILKAGRRAGRLVQQILTFSRRNNPRLGVIALRPAVEEAVALLRSTLPAGIRVDLRVDEPIPNVVGDSMLVQQIVLNLGTNAWHAMTGETGLIEIVLDTTDGAEEKSGQARLLVRDDGSGMDEATRQRIFEPFFSTKGPGVGTGLGLSVVHGIVRQMSGTVSVRSSPGAGATFEFLFPAEAGAVVAEPVRSPQQLRGNGEHVLYIDDEEPLVYLAVRILTALGYRASGFVRAEDGLAALGADPSAFDVVVTDYNMPGMSGLQVAREVAALRPDLPLLLTSGYINDELRQKAAEVGVQHLVEKPDTIEGLCATVHEVLRLHRPA